VSDPRLVIDGRHLYGRHPGQYPAEYRKTATVLATVAPQAGVVATPEGEMSFDAGDYLVTDNPPTHAWPVKRDVFERTYVQVHDLHDDGGRYE
jgi:hypothetical protein